MVLSVWCVAAGQAKAAESLERTESEAAPPPHGLTPQGLSGGHRKPGKAHKGRGSLGLRRKQAQASGGTGHAQGSRSPRPARCTRAAASSDRWGGGCILSLPALPPTDRRTHTPRVQCQVQAGPQGSCWHQLPRSPTQAPPPQCTPMGAHTGLRHSLAPAPPPRLLPDTGAGRHGGFLQPRSHDGSQETAMQHLRWKGQVPTSAGDDRWAGPRQRRLLQGLSNRRSTSV